MNWETTRESTVEEWLVQLGANPFTAAERVAAFETRIRADERAKYLREDAGEYDLVFEDLGAILRALGLFNGAQPISAHEVVQTKILPAIAARLDLASPEAEQRLAAIWDSLHERISGFPWYEAEGPEAAAVILRALREPSSEGAADD